VALGKVGDRDVIVSAGADATVRIWDPADRRAETVMHLLGGVSACALRPPELSATTGSSPSDDRMCATVGRALCTFTATNPR
jgi:WD40 repeat protein